MAGAVLGLRLRALHWVLPVMLVFGVCLMHTLGHLTTGYGMAVHEGMDPAVEVGTEPLSVVAVEPSRAPAVSHVTEFAAVVVAEPVLAAAAGPVAVVAAGSVSSVVAGLVPRVGREAGPVVGAGAGVGFDPMAVCLAVLGSVLVLVFSMVAVRVARRASYNLGGTAGAVGVARSPPRRTVASLAELSVMRT